MSYQVLARKWRPRNFSELVGQTHVLKTLINALENDRLHHAYLFTGTRGVGKTTIARILARCLNCDLGVTATPCGVCTSCTEISEGRFLDLIEVDAASRTKVEDTRELLENVQYAPSRGRYKVYLIDEVHMLSTHSFNALLKTLEEPPPHVKFLLATTDPQKLPVTVLSRCLQFNLKNLSPERLVEHLRHILGVEQIPYEDGALWQLGRAAQGSVRDCLTLLDQAIGFCEGNLSAAQVSEFLGNIDQAVIVGLMQALIDEDPKAALQRVSDVAEHAPDFASVLQELLSWLHRVAIAQVVPDAIDNSLGDREQVLAHAASLSAETLQLYYQIALKGREDLPFALDPRSGLEMTLLRMLAFAPAALPALPQQALPAGSGEPPADQTSSAGSGQKKKPLSEASAGQVNPPGRSQTTLSSADYPGRPAAPADPVAPDTGTQSATSVPGSAGQGSAEGESTVVGAETPKEAPLTASQAAPGAVPAAGQNAAQPDEVPGLTRSRPPTALVAQDAGVNPGVPVAKPHTERLRPVAEEDPDDEAADDEDDHPAYLDDPYFMLGLVDRSVSASPQDPVAFPDNLQTEPASQGRGAASQAPETRIARYPQGSGGDLTAKAINGGSSTPASALASTDPNPASAVLDQVVGALPPPAERIALADLKPGHWVALFRQLDMTGVTRSMAGNSLLVEVTGNQLRLMLDETQATLFNDEHRKRIEAAMMAYFEVRIELQMLAGAINGETPVAMRKRLEQEYRESARRKFSHDPMVQELVRQFAAEIQPESVVPLEPFQW